MSATTVNANNGYTIGINRVLSTLGDNLFVGISAGANTGGGNGGNVFVGTNAGRANTTGSTNSFFGGNVGVMNDTGSANSFFGFGAGFANTSSDHNSFFGYSAGGNNTSSNNSFFGWQAGVANTGGANNSFFGAASGFNNTGLNNSFFGNSAGLQNTQGIENSFFGISSGQSNTTGNFNTVMGARADVLVANLRNATAIGANAAVNQSNSLVLGSINQVNGGTANTSVGIGTTAPSATLSVVGFEPPNIGGATGTNATPALQVVGGKGGAGFLGGNGSNIFLQGGDGGNGQGGPGGVGGSIYLLPGASGSPSGTHGAVGIGTTTPNTELDVAGNAFVRGSGSVVPFNLSAADLQVGFGLASPGTLGSVARLSLQPYGHTSGPWKFIARDDATKAYLDWVYGPAGTGITQDSSGNVGIGTNVPPQKLTILDSSNTGLRVQTNSTGGNVASFGGNGAFEVDAPGISGGRLEVTEAGNVGIGTNIPAVKLQVKGDVRVGTSGTLGCLQRFDGTALTGFCSSDVRFKRNITPFPNLLDKITRLQPVHYYWRSAEYPDKHFGNSQSYGLVAQEVERVLPELVGQDEQGYKTVDYSKLPLMMLEAIKEQQAEIETLRKTNAAMAARLRSLEQRRRKR